MVQVAREPAGTPDAVPIVVVATCHVRAVRHGVGQRRRRRCRRLELFVDGDRVDDSVPLGRHRSARSRVVTSSSPGAACAGSANRVEIRVASMNAAMIRVKGTPFDGLVTTVRGSQRSLPSFYGPRAPRDAVRQPDSPTLHRHVWAGTFALGPEIRATRMALAIARDLHTQDPGGPLDPDLLHHARPRGQILDQVADRQDAYALHGARHTHRGVGQADDGLDRAEDRRMPRAWRSGAWHPNAGPERPGWACRPPPPAPSRA